ncbi:unnamed protein product [Miscanthus lutarioriparius]|uniref:BACK domain-containing protein n=1 Tax=Miscanthus lutarioriparius TaxID=422564 RepID=A0A811P0Z2_9POAL|nr:unnamed protein product [Miscanthus lutarioriparius]
MASLGKGEEASCCGGSAVCLTGGAEAGISEGAVVGNNRVYPLRLPSTEEEDRAAKLYLIVCFALSWISANRLIESSSYFRALLGGSFSESGREHVNVGCDLEAAVQVLRYLFEPSESFNITHNNFLPLLEGALFLAVESLLVECERWFSTIASQTSAIFSVPLDFIIEVWDFAQEHGVTFVQEICREYLAQNFAHVISRRSFNKIPYDLLCSTIECPHLTVDSEKQLCEAILYWVSENMKTCEQSYPNSVDGHLFLLSKVKICLLPLGFAAGTKRHWFDFGNNIVCTILDLLKDSLKTLLDAIADGNLERYCIRITEYSKNIVLSGCPQVTTAFLYISVLPTDLDVSFKRRILSILLLPYLQASNFIVCACADVGLLEISVLKNSLCYINIRNCFLLTDDGISNLLMKCTKIHSMVLSYTSFGNRSIQTLCATNPSGHNSVHAHVMAFYMQELHLDGCKGIDSAALSQLMSIISITKFLSLRETSLTDGALCKFVGSSLEYLDVSETVISMVSLAPVIRRNCKLNCLKTAGCRSLLLECDNVENISGNKYGDFLQEVGTTCCLEDVEMGWGFCPIRIEDLAPSFSKVRKMTIGLGTALAENVMCALPMICPFLESLILRFQVISDRVVRNLLESAVNLHVLCLHYCLGSLTSFSFQTKAPALRVLQLHWVTPWLTNDDLTILTENCNLAELSLSGCKHLDSNSQDIISSGWPNLALLHLEECGKITVEGFLLFSVVKLWKTSYYGTRYHYCGSWLWIYAMPVKKNAEGKMIRSVRMSRCKTMKGSCLEVARQGSSRPVHKDTVVLEWSSRRLTTTIVKERV